jgi:hypothetical protein
VNIGAVLAAVLTMAAASVTADRYWIDRDAGLSMAVAAGFALDMSKPSGKGTLKVESERGGVYRTCSARTGPDGEQVAAMIRERGADPQWVRSICEATAYPPDLPIRNRRYLAGATDDSDLGLRHSCVVAYEVDDAELRSLGLSHVIRQASVMTAGDRIVNLNCTLAARDESIARAHWQTAEEVFGAMRASISHELAP